MEEESICRAMDTRGTGEFVPLSFNKNGQLSAASRKHLASPEKLARIRDHLDGLLTRMAKDLYGGRIAAEPFVPGGKSPCQYCDYRSVCRHADGENERLPETGDDPFEP